MTVRAGAKIAELLAHAQNKTFQDVILEGFAILAAEIDALREEVEHEQGAQANVRWDEDKGKWVDA